MYTSAIAKLDPASDIPCCSCRTQVRKLISRTSRLTYNSGLFYGVENMEGTRAKISPMVYRFTLAPRAVSSITRDLENVINCELLYEPQLYDPPGVHAGELP